MGTATLLLAFHNHQPQGNFETVFAQGYQDCYLPQLEALERHPGIKANLHFSGPLAEWIDRHAPDFFGRIATLVEARRVELLGGGHYEPMLSVLPERDALGQLKMMSEFLATRTGTAPRGMWLAERVWEPDLARIIATAGYRYTVVDDGHFLAAGHRRPLHGYFVTEKAGLTVSLFPISMELRYKIPFKPVEETIGFLRGLGAGAGSGEVVVTYGDDGEKFGMWPGTKKLVWEDGWLDRLFGAIEASHGAIRTATFSEIMRSHKPQGRIYLPSTSYDEMGRWALPPEAQDRYNELTRHIAQQGKVAEWGPFIRGGIWQGFLAKYPEANLMHKRMCYVSERVSAAAQNPASMGDPAAARLLNDATRELYRGQCNCAYWHGLFGGLYLPKLRQAVHSHLIRAHVTTCQVTGTKQPGEMERLDLTGDLTDEVLLYNRALGLIVAPGRGGTVLAIDDRRRAFCITDVLTRRREIYHARIIELCGVAREARRSQSPRLFDEIEQLKDEGLAAVLVYDPHERLAFVDQFVATDVTADAFYRCEAVDRGDFKASPYELLQSAGGSGRVTLRRAGKVLGRDGELVDVALHKSFTADGATLTVKYEITAASALPGICFATELSLMLPSGPHPDGEVAVFTEERTERSTVEHHQELGRVQRLELRDASDKLSIVLLPSPAARLVRFPLHTASQSESGYERNYQGTTFVLLWPADLRAGESFTSSLRLQIA